MTIRGILFAVIFALPMLAAADPLWLDAEARIEYAYFTEDERALVRLTSSLGEGDGTDVMRSYYAALAHYRLTLLRAERDRSQARESIDGCVDHLDRALKVDPDFAEGLALQAACLGMLASLKPLRAPFAGPKSNSQIAKAMQLAPRNPRVLLLHAVLGSMGSNTPGSHQRVSGRLQEAVDAFETERQGVTPVPGWGAAEAYMRLARSYLERGDMLAARNVLERALLIAPEFAQARRLMIHITSG